MYSFLGISLATQDYINPSIDIIKKKGVVSTAAANSPQTTSYTMFFFQQGVRFDPDLPQTIRLEFAKSNTKVSKPKQVLAPQVLTQPPLVHPLTGRK